MKDIIQINAVTTVFSGFTNVRRAISLDQTVPEMQILNIFKQFLIY